MSELPKCQAPGCCRGRIIAEAWEAPNHDCPECCGTALAFTAEDVIAGRVDARVRARLDKAWWVEQCQRMAAAKAQLQRDLQQQTAAGANLAKTVTGVRRELRPLMSRGDENLSVVAMAEKAAFSQRQWWRDVLKHSVVHNALACMLNDRETVPEDTVELAGAALEELYNLRIKLRTYEEQQPSVQLLRGELRKLAACLLESVDCLRHTCRLGSHCAACEQRRKHIELARRWQ